MKEYGKREIKQWIPWEISYSLKEVHREVGRSGINAVLAVVISDRTGSYAYAIVEGRSKKIMEHSVFNIIYKNMYNIKNLEKYRRPDGSYDERASYIPAVKWSDFKTNPDKYLEIAESHRDNYLLYEIRKEIDPSW